MVVGFLLLSLFLLVVLLVLVLVLVLPVLMLALGWLADRRRWRMMLLMLIVVMLMDGRLVKRASLCKWLPLGFFRGGRQSQERVYLSRKV